MNRSDLPQDVLDGAYRIFIQEVAQTVSDTQFILLEEDLTGHPLLKEAKNKIHKIRGGAGFFGLSDIERSASKLESFVKMLLDHQNQERSELRNAYNELVENLQTSIKPQE